MTIDALNFRIRLSKFITKSIFVITILLVAVYETVIEINKNKDYMYDGTYTGYFRLSYILIIALCILSRYFSHLRKIKSSCVVNCIMGGCIVGTAFLIEIVKEFSLFFIDIIYPIINLQLFSGKEEEIIEYMKNFFHISIIGSQILIVIIILWVNLPIIANRNTSVFDDITVR